MIYSILISIIIFLFIDNIFINNQKYDNKLLYFMQNINILDLENGVWFENIFINKINGEYTYRHLINGNINDYVKVDSSKLFSDYYMICESWYFREPDDIIKQFYLPLYKRDYYIKYFDMNGYLDTKYIQSIINKKNN